MLRGTRALRNQAARRGRRARERKAGAGARARGRERLRTLNAPGPLGSPACSTTWNAALVSRLSIASSRPFRMPVDAEPHFSE